eukprot:TRINITY_DN12384_c0_g1_i3.p3 TRINITY_DN12384_c0_g1~~TRINITY_DN12384_c0_g1_i3.p3  ORF type:complete len:203 (+),score=26.34 TRINITY_DN12384_c0_g1_i3:3620-4228(+)
MGGGSGQFRLLYSYSNETLKHTDTDARRRLLQQYTTVSLHGDGELSVYAAHRAAFDDNIQIARHQILRSWADCFPARRQAGIAAVEHELELCDNSLLDFLATADKSEAFLRCSSLPADAFRPDGMVKRDAAVFHARDNERAWEALAFIDQHLNGNVLNAWFDEDVNDVELDRFTCLSTTDGNVYHTIMLTPARVYAMRFVTS